MGEERNELKTELLSKKEAELKDLENSQPIHISVNTKSVAEQPFDKKISTGVNHRPNQPSQWKHCQFELKGA